MYDSAGIFSCAKKADCSRSVGSTWYPVFKRGECTSMKEDDDSSKQSSPAAKLTLFAGSKTLCVGHALSASYGDSEGGVFAAASSRPCPQHRSVLR
jgi:hypothetical protein